MTNNVEEHEEHNEYDEYEAPQVIDLGATADVTLGKYAEDSQDQGKYFE